jgi:diguanylate cyclase (GGDEF)-like protein
MGSLIGDRAIRSGFVLGGILLIAYVDFSSGVELRVFPLYYVPISFAAWHFGRAGAVVTASLCAFAWFGSNQLAGMQFSHPAVWVANSILQGASFTIVGLLVAGLKLAASRARALSRMDSLCPLLNSRAFYEDCGRLLALCRRAKRPVTLAYLDLDDFKAVNDTRGHAQGDALLRTIAQTLLSSIRSSDVAARLGGDEFAIMMPELGPNEARQTLERLRRALGQPTPDLFCTIAVSVGAVTFMMAPDDAQAMVQMADSVMYSAKKDGKNRIHLKVVRGAAALGEVDPSVDAPSEPAG